MQPFLHDSSVTLRAPIQCLSTMTGQVDAHERTPGGPNANGVYCGDDRVLSQLLLSVVDHDVSHLHTDAPGGPSARYTSAIRTPELGIGPHLVMDRRRTLTGSGLREDLNITSGADQTVTLKVALQVCADGSPVSAIKDGLDKPGTTIPVFTWEDTCVRWSWRDGHTSAVLCAPGAEISFHGAAIQACWTIIVPARSSVTVGCTVEMSDTDAPFVAPVSAPLTAPTSTDPALAQLLHTAIADANGLTLADRSHPDEPFLAAGSPWFFTLFGRDSLIAALLLAPCCPRLGASTLRVLARRQGVAVDPRTEETPGKILHEVRRTEFTLELDTAAASLVLPPEYYGSVDSTPLWLILFNRIVKQLGWDELRDVEPTVVAAARWLLDYSDPDGDGFLEYQDSTGHGLANQGWKDSADSIRWTDGRQAEGPIALCEVQGYAYQAATQTADFFDAHGIHADLASELRSWASDLKRRFREQFWVEDAVGPYPAIALDAHKQAVDGAASNMGHLLATGILDEAECAAVVRRLMAPDMFSGFGIRTLASSSAAYWPVGYHTGSVWTHDTAVIIEGLLAARYVREASELAMSLLAAAAGFDYHLPELFSGFGADRTLTPIPYPASCHPQAWAAASAVTIARALEPSIFQ